MTKGQWSHSYSSIVLFSSLYFLDLRCPPPEPRHSDFLCSTALSAESTLESNQHFQRFCDLKIQTGAAIEHVCQCRVRLLGMCLASTKVDRENEPPSPRHPSPVPRRCLLFKSWRATNQVKPVLTGHIGSGMSKEKIKLCKWHQIWSLNSSINYRNLTLL